MPIAKKPSKSDPATVEEFLNGAATGDDVPPTTQSTADAPVEASAEAPEAAPVAATPAPAAPANDNSRRIALLATAVSVVTLVAFGWLAFNQPPLQYVTLADVKAKGVFKAVSEARAPVVAPTVPAYAVGIAINQLRQVIRTNAPFKAELITLAAVASQDAELAKIVSQLVPRSGTGIATVDELRAGFDQIVTQVASAQIDPTGLLNRGLAQLRMVASRTGASMGNDGTGLALVRASAALDEGDLAQAVGELSQFEGQLSGGTLDEWLVSARARMLAQDADAKLSALLVTRFGGR